MLSLHQKFIFKQSNGSLTTR